AGQARGLVVAQAVFVDWFSASRAGALGLLAGLGVSPLALRHKWLLASLVVAVAAAVVLRRDLLLGNGREELWAVAWRMFAASPLLGQGPASFKAAWLANPRAWAPNHPHNLYLHL